MATEPTAFRQSAVAFKTEVCGLKKMLAKVELQQNEFMALRYGSPNVIRFMRWLDSKDGEQHRKKDEKGEKVILRSGWEKAQEEYNRIKGLKGNSENDLKVREPTYSIE